MEKAELSNEDDKSYDSVLHMCFILIERSLVIESIYLAVYCSGVEVESVMERKDLSKVDVRQMCTQIQNLSFLYCVVHRSLSTTRLTAAG